MNNVIDFSKKPEKPEPKPGKYEFHIHPSIVNPDVVASATIEDDLVTVEGFLRFGPQFVAVTNGLLDDSDVVFAIQTPAVRYVKRIGEGGQIEGTLSPGG